MLNKMRLIKMKRYFYLLLLAVLPMCFAACKDGDDESGAGGATVEGTWRLESVAWSKYTKGGGIDPTGNPEKYAETTSRGLSITKVDGKLHITSTVPDIPGNFEQVGTNDYRGVGSGDASSQRLVITRVAGNVLTAEFYEDYYEISDGQRKEYGLFTFIRLQESQSSGGGSNGDSGNTGNEHEYVDLGLPSGTLWATCNVGAEKPEDYGDYFAWGETKPKSVYTWDTYKWCNGLTDKNSDVCKTITKYCANSYFGYNGFTDNKTELEAADDAATANWGSGWQMPTLDQIKELYKGGYTTTEWTTQNDVNGRKITSKSNGNSIFLPAAGYISRPDNVVGVYGSASGHYWSRSLSSSYSDSGCLLHFGPPHDDYPSDIYWSHGYRYGGMSVRPVRVD